MNHVVRRPSPGAPRDPDTGTTLESEPDRALFLDVDGTLLHVAETPGGVEVSERFRVADGKMVLEIRPRLTDKGAAVAALLAESPLAGRRPVFIGDDVTDEDAFAMVNDLCGNSIRVGAAPGTRARFRLPDVAAVVAWLESIPAALGAGDSTAAP